MPIHVSSQRAGTHLNIARLTKETRVRQHDSSLIGFHSGNIGRRVKRGALTLLALVGVVAIVGCAVPGQATGKPTATPTCSIAMQWSNAGDTTGQGTPDASSQPITTFSAGTNAHGVQCTAVVTQAKTAHFLSNIQKALQMTSKQLDALKVQVWNGNAGKPYPSNYDIASGADGRSKRYRAILASASVGNGASQQRMGKYLSLIRLLLPLFLK